MNVVLFWNVVMSVVDGQSQIWEVVYVIGIRAGTGEKTFSVVIFAL